MNNWKEFLKVFGMGAAVFISSKILKHFVQETTPEQFHGLTLIAVVLIGMIVYEKLSEIMAILKEIHSRLLTE